MPRPPRPKREERITASGMRLIGAAGRMISDAAAAGLARPAHADDILYAATFQLRPRLGTSPVNHTIAVLSTALTKAHPEFRPLDRESGNTEVKGRSHAIHWQVATGSDRWTGELLWRHPHPTIPGVPLTTHAILSEQPGIAAMTIRVGTPGGARAVLGPVGAGQAHPPFLTDLNRLVRLVYGGLDGDPRTLGEGEIETFVAGVLVAENRVAPALVLAPTERGDYLVPPSQIAEEFLGVAHLYVIDRHPTTFRLSDTLGDRRLSCYWGALRAYRPGFSCADAPRDHPLLVSDRMTDPVVRTQLRGTLGLEGRSLVPEPTGVEEIREANRPKPRATPPNPQKPEPVADDVPTASAAGSPAPPAPDRALDGVQHRLDEAIGALDRLLKINTDLIDEVAALRTNNAVRGATAAGLERRLGEIERLLRDHFDLTRPGGEETPAGDEQEPAAAGDAMDEEAKAVTLASVVRQAAMTHDDALLVLDDAIRTAEESPYRDIDRVAAVLGAMALVARRRQAGTLGTSLRDTFRDLGVDYRSGVADSTPERLRRQYLARLPSGETVDATEHIALGGSYDPRHCLRIYFTSRAPAEPRFVIAHVGRHRDVISTT